MRIGDIMTRDVEFVAAGMTIADVAATMGDLSVGALPVGSADDLRRQDLLEQVREEQTPAARTRVRVRNPAGEGGVERKGAAQAPRPGGDDDRIASGERDERDDPDGDDGPAVPPDGEAAPRKRRRRRKPRGGGEGGAEGSSGASKPVSDASGNGHDA